MRLTRVSIGLLIALALASAVAAAAGIWLLVSDPLSVAGALQQGGLAAIAKHIAEVIADAARVALKWL